MRSWLRRIRGAAGIGITWAFVWGAVGSVPHRLFGVNTDAPLPLIFSVFGFLAGVIFAALVVLTQRHRRIEQLSLPRFAGWGAAGGVLLSLIFARAVSFGWGEVLVIAPTLGAASAICAAGSLALARRASRARIESGTRPIPLSDARETPFPRR